MNLLNTSLKSVSPMFTKDLGRFATDQVTGFNGIVSGTIWWDRGNIQYSIKPKMTDDGKMPEAFWIDTNFLQFDDEKSISVDGIKYKDFEFQCGDVVKSIHSGFEGTVTGMMLHINGCHQYHCVAKKLHEGKEIEQWLDTGETVIVKATKNPTRNHVKTQLFGGPSTRVTGKHLG